MLPSTYNLGHAVSCVEGIGTDEAVEIHTFLHLCDYAVVSVRLRFRLLCRWWTHIHSLTINTNYLMNEVYSSKCTFKLILSIRVRTFKRWIVILFMILKELSLIKGLKYFDNFITVA